MTQSLIELLAGADKAGQYAQDQIGRSPSLKFGVVADNSDPQKLRRIRVTSGSKGGLTNHEWAMRVLPCPFFDPPMPTSSQSVSFAFFEGDPHDGNYLGVITNGVNPPFQKEDREKDGYWFIPGIWTFEVGGNQNVSVGGVSTLLVEEEWNITTKETHHFSEFYHHDFVRLPFKELPEASEEYRGKVVVVPGTPDIAYICLQGVDPGAFKWEKWAKGTARKPSGGLLGGGMLGSIASVGGLAATVASGGVGALAVQAVAGGALSGGLAGPLSGALGGSMGPLSGLTTGVQGLATQGLAIAAGGGLGPGGLSTMLSTVSGLSGGDLGGVLGAAQQAIGGDFSGVLGAAEGLIGGEAGGVFSQVQSVMSGALGGDLSGVTDLVGNLPIGDVLGSIDPGGVLEQISGALPSLPGLNDLSLPGMGDLGLDLEGLGAIGELSSTFDISSMLSSVPFPASGMDAITGIVDAIGGVDGGMLPQVLSAIAPTGDVGTAIDGILQLSDGGGISSLLQGAGIDVENPLASLGDLLPGELPSLDSPDALFGILGFALPGTITEDGRLPGEFVPNTRSLTPVVSQDPTFVKFKVSHPELILDPAITWLVQPLLEDYPRPMITALFAPESDDLVVTGLIASALAGEPPSSTVIIPEPTELEQSSGDEQIDIAISAAIDQEVEDRDEAIADAMLVQTVELYTQIEALETALAIESSNHSAEIADLQSATINCTSVLACSFDYRDLVPIGHDYSRCSIGVLPGNTMARILQMTVSEEWSYLDSFSVGTHHDPYWIAGAQDVSGQDVGEVYVKWLPLTGFEEDREIFVYVNGEAAHGAMRVMIEYAHTPVRG